jgi:hypothetical protein
MKGVVEELVLVVVAAELELGLDDEVIVVVVVVVVVVEEAAD